MKKFFKNLEDFFLEDIRAFEERCYQIDSTSKDTSTTSNKGRNLKLKFPATPKLTIPIALSVFAVADVLGYLSREEIDAKETDTTENLKAIFKGLDVLNGKKFVEKFINVYRHGIIHSYFPKHKLEIAYFSYDPIDKLFIEKNGGFYLNLKCLINHLKKSLNEIKLKSEESTTIKLKFKYLMCKYELIEEDFIHNLKIKS